MPNNHPDDGRSASEAGDRGPGPASEPGAADRQAPTGIRAELPDGYAYYAELLIAVDGHHLPVPQPRTAQDDRETHRASANSKQDMARFGDTWT